MHKLMIAMIIGTALLLAGQGVRPAEKQLQSAINKEVIVGDLKGAIGMYLKLAKSADRAIAAQALVRMGQCYEKLGDTEARKAYERVVRDFGDQKDLAEAARTRLSALGRAGGLSYPPGITFRKVWVDRGGWLEGSPSPDGRYYSFTDYDTGDLALRDLITGLNRRLTNNGTSEDYDEWAESSVISGDGGQIAYAWCINENHYELRVIGIDGSHPRTVYRDKEFCYYIAPHQWTADGKQILAALMRNKEECQFALIPVEGGPVRLLKTQAPGPWHPSLSPDGRFLVYGGLDKPNGRESDIFLIPLEGGPEVPLIQSPAENICPIWMPTGNKVLFISDRTGTRGFWTIDVVEGKPQGMPQLLKDGVGIVGGAVRPNGFTRRGDFFFSTSTGISDVYVTELDLAEGKMLRQPVPVAPRFVGSNVVPSWSPDGRRLAYYRLGDAYAQKPPTLVIQSLETGEAKDIPVKLKLSPFRIIWHPSGKSLFVTTFDSPERGHLINYLVDIQTGDHRPIRSHSYPVPGAGDISPDGKTVLFFTGGEPKLRGGIIACDIETGKEREIARIPDLAAGGFPSLRVSPDSKYLALRVPIDGGQWIALRLVPATGGEWRELCRFPRSDLADYSYYDLAWTPDGSNLLILRNTGKKGMPELWRIPIASGESQRTGLSMEGIYLVAPHPDGRRIAFDIDAGHGSPNELWVLENFLPAVQTAR
jgi:Tol biopolymer transport system component